MSGARRSSRRPPEVPAAETGRLILLLRSRLLPHWDS